MDTVIGIDIGTQSTKILIIDGEGRILAESRQHYQVETPHPLWAEQWPDTWWNAVRHGLQEALAQEGIKPKEVQGLCVSSLYGGSGIPVDDQIEPLHPCLIWMDRRAEAEVEWVKQHIDLEKLADITGNGVDSYHGFTKMMWLKRNRPDIWKQTRYLLPPNSFINYCLSGEIAIDHSSAGNIGGIYDLKHRCWSGEMLEELGIEHDKQPSRLVDSDDVVGGLLASIAAPLGLTPGIPVVAGGVDAAMATLAAGASRPGEHVAMIGTSMCWGAITPTVDARQGLIAMPHVLNSDRDLYCFGGALTAGASVSWFIDHFCDYQDAATTDQRQVLAELESCASELPPGSEGLLFLPYLMGERSPIWDARASAGFIGLSLYHRRHHLFRAVLEGVTFALRHNMQAGQRQGMDLSPYLIVVGGATQSDLWMQIIADITHLPVMTYRDNVEAALGAALLAARATRLNGIDGMAWSSQPIERARPRPEAMERYDGLFDLYCRLYPTLKPVMHQLSTYTTLASVPHHEP